MKSLYKVILLIVLLAIVYLLANNISLPYYYNSNGVILPVREWSLEMLPGGSLLTTEKNNLNNNVTNSTNMVFQRGDHAEFVLNEALTGMEHVNMGDTIGVIKSHEEDRRLLLLQTQLNEQYGLLRISGAGEKQELIDAAREELLLAETEYKTQQRIKERMMSLHESGVLSDEAWELALNEYEVKKQTMRIARSLLDHAKTGSRPEETALIYSNLSSIQSQIEQAKQRREALIIRAPFSGNIIFQQYFENENGLVLRIADKSRMLIKIPVKINQFSFLNLGNEVRIQTVHNGKELFAKIIGIDNAVHHQGNEQLVFITAEINSDYIWVMPNMLVQAQIIFGDILLKDYIIRFFNTVF